MGDFFSTLLTIAGLALLAFMAWSACEGCYQAIIQGLAWWKVMLAVLASIFVGLICYCMVS